MSDKQLSEWRREVRLKRKAASMRKNRAKKGEEFGELKDELYELVCLAEGSVSMSKSEVIDRFKCRDYLNTLIGNDGADLSAVLILVEKQEQMLRVTGKNLHSLPHRGYLNLSAMWPRSWKWKLQEA